MLVHIWKQMQTFRVKIVKFIDNVKQYRKKIGELIYLTVTRPKISLNRFMAQPREIHWKATLQNLAYIKSFSGNGLLYKKHIHIYISTYSESEYTGDRGNKKTTIGYLTYVGGNFVTCRSKKRDVSLSIIDAEYQVMAYTIFKILQLNNLLIEFCFKQKSLMLMHCDNQFVINMLRIMSRLLTKKVICTPSTPSLKNLANILMKRSSKVFSNSV